MNQEVISLMKRRVDELTDDEIVVIKDYCEQKISRRNKIAHPASSGIGAAMVRHMIELAERSK